MSKVFRIQERFLRAKDDVKRFKFAVLRKFLTNDLLWKKKYVG
jgi:hypothetical protein